MPRTIIRPTIQETSAIDSLFRKRALSPSNHRKLCILSEWANGASMKNAGLAQSPKCCRETVRKIVRAYAAKGLSMFSEEASRGRGRPKVPESVSRAVVARLSESFTAGRPLSYAVVATEHGISESKVGQIAKGAKLDAKHRRGAVAPPP